MKVQTSGQQSFYSINSSKTDFTFIEDPPAAERLDIRQSSAIGLVSESQSEKELQLHDISGILEQVDSELERSMCLQREIDCLTLPHQPSPQELQQLQLNIDRLKQNQVHLQQQLKVFQGLLAVTRSNSEHLAKQALAAVKSSRPVDNIDSAKKYQGFFWPDSQQLTLKIFPGSPSASIDVKNIRHFDIKPNLNQSASEKQAKTKYKQASLRNRVLLLQDSQNQYRVEASYTQQQIEVIVTNYQSGQINFAYAVRLQDVGTERVSERIVYPLLEYQPKKFTLPLSVVLLFFKLRTPKEEENLLKAEEIRTISLPLPITCFIQERFAHQSLSIDQLALIRKKMHVYEIDLNYGVDRATYEQIKELPWIKKEWISLRGTNTLLWIELGKLREQGQIQRVTFKVGARQKDAQQAVDLIQYLCFMLAL